MKEKRKYESNRGEDTLKKCKKMYYELSHVTPKKLAAAVGIYPSYALRIWPKICGKTWTEDLESKVRAFLMVYHNASIEDASEYLEVSIKQVKIVWANVVSEFASPLDEEVLMKNAIKIPGFVPRAKKFISNDGKECTDVSEFFGIVENGGECYKNVRFTIPKGYADLCKED